MSRYGTCRSSARSRPTGPSSSSPSWTAPVHAAARRSVQPQLVVRVPIRGPNPLPEIEADPRDPEPARRGLLAEHGADLVGELGRDALVGVEGENPVVGRLRGREVLLRRIPRPVAHEDPRGSLSRQRHRVVGAPRVNDDDFVGPGHRCEGRADVRRFVAGDDGDRQPGHTGSIARQDSGVRARIQESRLQDRSAWRHWPDEASVTPPPEIGASWTVSKSTSDRL